MFEKHIAASCILVCSAIPLHAQSDGVCQTALRKVEEIHAWLGVRPVPPNTPMHEKIESITQETRGLAKSIAELPAKSRRAVSISVPANANPAFLADCNIHTGGTPGRTDCTNATNVNSPEAPIRKALAVAYCSTNFAMASGVVVAHSKTDTGAIGGRNIFINAVVCSD